MIINGLFPHSKLGKAGGIIYKFYVWVWVSSKKK
jgi:hypothetical protein